jgi:MFS family permease
MQTRAPLASWYALAAVSIAVLYSVIDRQVLILLSQPLKADLHLSDAQIGSLQGLGAALFTAIAAVPLGWLADRVDRRRLLAACILVWSAAIACCGLATGYWSLLLCVAFLAAGEAGLTPIVFALIPEIFPERQRVSANFIFFAAAIVGSGLGIALAGAVIDHIGLVARWFPDGLFSRQTWRMVFVVVAVPGLFMTLAILLIRKQQQNATQVRADASATSLLERPQMLSYLTSHWRAVVGIFVPSGMVALGMTAVFTWLPVILMRRFSTTPSQVGTGLGIAVAAGTLMGLACAAAGAKFMRPKWGRATPLRLLLIGYLVLALTTPLYLVARSPTDFFLIAWVQMTAVIGGSSLMPTMLQDMAPADLRGRVFAISTVITTVFQVISPITVGLLSDHLFTQAGGLLISSISVAGPGFLLAAVSLWLGEKHILKTVDEVIALSDFAGSQHDASSYGASAATAALRENADPVFLTKHP